MLKEEIAFWLYIYRGVYMVYSADSLYQLAEVEVGQHFYWNIGGLVVHGQVMMMTWLVIAILLLGTLAATRDMQAGISSDVPNISTGQNFMEYILEYLRDLTKGQIGEEDYRSWVPYIGTLFLFIFVANWAGALLPLRVIELPNGELGAPTSDINTTVALALMTSVAYFYAGISKKGLGYFSHYLEPIPFLLPLKVLEDFTKPLSLSFRLFCNVLADELVVAVLVSLVPLVVPLPIMVLGLFASAVQALIFATLSASYIGEAVEDHH